MIGRRSKRKAEVTEVEPKWFDDFDLRLGDMMRGERATMGKSLLDVQRELRIKAAYIAAIENADPSAFDTPGFIAGYVRSYARYLNMDPDKAYDAFCAESGFTTAHGMSAEASSIRKPMAEGGFASGLGAGMGTGLGKVASEPFSRGGGFTPASDGLLSQIEPRAVGSTLVLLALVAGLGFGGWTILNEVQRVQIAPVEHVPDVLADLDPLSGAAQLGVTNDMEAETARASGVFTPPSDRLDRLYRPQALDVPVMVARDAPISTLDPRRVGTFADENAILADAGASTDGITTPSVPQVVEDVRDGVVLFAVRPAWVRVRAADGSVIFEKILEAGEEYELPATEEAPTLQAGMSGSLFFEIDGELYGPAGQGTSTVRKLAMGREALLENYELADFESDPVLSRVVAEMAQPTEPQQ
ncbi:MAG: helix-turn-helix domain-containing protein [Rhodobacterales bacterium]|nr:MAG: helix-turn-helix domain-containing protein [Rhodobacterales bacterium]